MSTDNGAWVGGVLVRLGIRLVGKPGQPVGSQFRVAFPTQTIQINLDDEPLLNKEFWVKSSIDKLYDAQQAIFHAARLHMCEYDERGYDRLRQVEQAAKALADTVLASERDLVKCGAAAYQLKELLQAKPGALTWHPSEVVK